MQMGKRCRNARHSRAIGLARPIGSSQAFLPPEESWVHAAFGKHSTIKHAGATPAAGLTADGVGLVARGVVVAAAGPVRGVWVTVDFFQEAGGEAVASGT